MNGANRIHCRTKLNNSNLTKNYYIHTNVHLLCVCKKHRFLNALAAGFSLLRACSKASGTRSCCSCSIPCIILQFLTYPRFVEHKRTADELVDSHIPKHFVFWVNGYPIPTHISIIHVQI